MKKMSMACMAVLCLAIPSRASRGVTWLDTVLEAPEQEVGHLKEDLKDAAKLKKCMLEKLLSSHLLGDGKAFMRRFGVSDKAMEAVLLDIIREKSQQTGWKMFEQGDPMDIRVNAWYLYEAIQWLGICAETEGKKLLLDITLDKSKAFEFRHIALWRYMRRADAQEMREILPRAVAGDAGSRDSSTVYINAMVIHDTAEGDEEKRKAIIETVADLLAKEKDKSTFASADQALAERSKEYAESPQRKAAQERFKKPPDKEVK